VASSGWSSIGSASMPLGSSLHLSLLPAAPAVAPRTLDPPLGVAVLQRAIPQQMHLGCIPPSPVHRLSRRAGFQNCQFSGRRHLCLHHSRLRPRMRRLILLPTQVTTHLHGPKSGVLSQLQT
jgi:hypothetical protein